MIVALEGIDASGKQTIANRIRKLGIDYSVEVASMPFPQYESTAGRVLSKFLRGAASTTELGIKTPMKSYREWDFVNALVVQSLFAVDRYAAQKHVAPYKDNNNAFLILDRYWMSGVAYGVNDGLPEKWLIDIHRQLIQPDIWILLDISVEESFMRRPDREDYYERNSGKLHKVRNTYRELFVKSREETALSLCQAPEWRVVDGMASVEEVTKEVAKIIFRDRSERAI